jgi:hypothetical protein
MSFGLHRGASIKTPQGKIAERWRGVKPFDRRLSTQLGDGLFAVEP